MKLQSSCTTRQQGRVVMVFDDETQPLTVSTSGSEVTFRLLPDVSVLVTSVGIMMVREAVLLRPLRPLEQKFPVVFKTTPDVTRVEQPGSRVTLGQMRHCLTFLYSACTSLQDNHH